jgi:hypothetical protein
MGFDACRVIGKIFIPGTAGFYVSQDVIDPPDKKAGVISVGPYRPIADGDIYG